MIIARTPLSLPIGNGGGSHADVATLGSVDPLAQPGVRVTAPATGATRNLALQRKPK